MQDRARGEFQGPNYRPYQGRKSLVKKKDKAKKLL